MQHRRRLGPLRKPFLARLEKDDVPTSPIAVRTAFDLSWFRPPSFGSRAVHGTARLVRSSDVPWRCKEHVCASDAQRMERTAAAVGGRQVPPLETFPVEDPLSCPTQIEDGRDPLRGMSISDTSRVRSASIGRSFGFERGPSGRRFPFRWIPPGPCGGERERTPPWAETRVGWIPSGSFRHELTREGGKGGADVRLDTTGRRWRRTCPDPSAIS